MTRPQLAGREGGALGKCLLCRFWKIKIANLNFGKKCSDCCVYRLKISYLKRCFKNIWEILFRNLSLQGLSFMYCRWNVYRMYHFRSTTRNFSGQGRFYSKRTPFLQEISPALRTCCLCPWNGKCRYHKFREIHWKAILN